ncbi:Gryzun, putative trafficking through golgi-domain-containing protein, partial [Thamnocephalis sphaerospora]
TQRWQETRILVDMISFKISKMHLYADAPVAAVNQFNKHMTVTRRIAEDRGLGRDHFKHLTWEMRQYRLFGELVEIALKNGFKLPITATVQAPSGGGTAVDPDSLLQHPGFYYHAAAMCVARRRRSFMRAEKDHTAAMMAPADQVARFVSVLDPAFAEALDVERGVDHSAMAIELLTKSYEQFKRFRNVRMTLYLASEIATEYFEAAKYDMAIKFFDRIAKTYRKERWYTVLQSILSRSLECSRPLSMWDKAVEYLVELLSDRIPSSEKDRMAYQRELFEILRVVFRYGTTFSGVAAPLQVTLATTASAPMLPIQIDSLRINFNSLRHGYRFDHDTDGASKPEAPIALSDSTSLQLIDCTDAKKTNVAEPVDGPETVWTKQVDLSITRGLTKVFEGIVVPTQQDELSVVSMEAVLRFPAWEITMQLKPDYEAPRRWVLPSERAKNALHRFIALDGSTDRTILRVMRRQPKFEVQIEHPQPAYLDEYYPLTIKLINSETDNINATFSAEMKMIGATELDDMLTLDPTSNTGGHILKQMNAGTIEAGQTATRTLYMRATRVVGERSVQLRVRYQLASHENNYEKGISTIVDVVQPFETSFEAFPLRQQIGYGEDDDAVLLKREEINMLVVRICSCGPWDVEVEQMSLELKKPPNDEATATKLISASTSGEHFAAQVWTKEQVVQANYLLQMSTPNTPFALPVADVGPLVLKWKRASTGSASPSYPCFSSILVPSVELDEREVSVVAEHPPFASAHEPFTLTYRVRNPTARLEELSASMETADGFVFAGMRQVMFRVMPMSCYRLRYNLYPLRTGRLKLPRLRLQCVREVTREIKVLGQDGSVDGMTLFVMPAKSADDQ